MPLHFIWYAWWQYLVPGTFGRWVKWLYRDSKGKTWSGASISKPHRDPVVVHQGNSIYPFSCYSRIMFFQRLTTKLILTNSPYKEKITSLPSHRLRLNLKIASSISETWMKWCYTTGVLSSRHISKRVKYKIYCWVVRTVTGSESWLVKGNERCLAPLNIKQLHGIREAICYDHSQAKKIRDQYEIALIVKTLQCIR